MSVVRALKTLSLALALQYAPTRAWACAVCFGQSDNKNLGTAFYIGGAILLGCTFSLLGGLVYAIMRMEKARLAQDRAMGLLDEGASS